MCRQATSHYLSQCWPRSMSPQWVNVLATQGTHFKTQDIWSHGIARAFPEYPGFRTRRGNWADTWYVALVAMTVTTTYTGTLFIIISTHSYSLEDRLPVDFNQDSSSDSGRQAACVIVAPCLCRNNWARIIWPTWVAGLNVKVGFKCQWVIGMIALNYWYLYCIQANIIHSILQNKQLPSACPHTGGWHE